MAIATNTKTWQHLSSAARSVNVAITPKGSALATNRYALWTIKNLLTGFASSPWVVVASTDGSANAPASSDVWDDAVKVVFGNAGTNHSWIRLKQAGIATNFEILIDCTASASGNTMAMYFSPTGFTTGGTKDTAPTAAAGSSATIIATNNTWLNNTSDIALRVSMMQSTDGQATRVVICGAGAVLGVWVFDKPANPSTGWSNPAMCWVCATSPTISAVCSVSATYGKILHSTSPFAYNVTFQCEGNASSVYPNDSTVGGNIANEISSEWPMVPVGFACSGAGARGRHGALNDVWMASAACASGDTYPVADADFAQFGCLIFPWDRGALNLS